MADDIDDLLSTPRRETVDALAASPGDVVVLGAGGKMGPTLARMVARARDRSERRVYAVSRWSNAVAAQRLSEAGVEVVHADLLDPRAVAALPDAANVIFMAGQKFGTAGAPHVTWAMNTVVPMYCAERYAGSRIVVFSTGNVYPMTPVAAGGARESDPVGPVGEYAASCVGRERVFEHFSHRHGTAVAIVRLNYAIDVRYGVLLDIAMRVATGEAVALEMGYVNVIWQGDANRIAIECLSRTSAPPFVVNVTGTEILSVRDLANRFGARLGKSAHCTGTARDDALLSNTDRMRGAFAPPDVGTEEMIDRIVGWIEAGGSTLGKPTHFETRDGIY